MKKTLLSLAFLSLCSATMAGPLDDKVNAYNAVRASTPSTTMMDVRVLLRNEPGVTASGSTTANSCAICGLTPAVVERPGAGTSLTATNPTEIAQTIAASILTAIPQGLGVIPEAIVRTSTGTGAAWLPPDASVDARYASYNSQFEYHQNQYNAELSNIHNAYMDPNTGRLARKRIEILNNVEQDMAAYARANPNATVAQRANMEAALIQGHSSGISTLTAEYAREMNAIRANFDAQLTYARYVAETPQDHG